MVDRLLIDTLNLNARNFALKWTDKIRKASHLKHYTGLTDEALVEFNAPFYPQLARSLDRGLDRSIAGDFFVTLGKKRMQEGFPISETIYGLNLTEQVVHEYLMNDFVLDSTIRMYQAMGSASKASEFFLLGCFYLTKGSLEAIYTLMNKNDAVSEELLKKYFRDDFFFKNG
jgi:hypothetical protein